MSQQVRFGEVGFDPLALGLIVDAGIDRFEDAGAGFVLNFVLAGEVGYFDAAAETKPLLHLWSLAVEEQFYIIWPVVAFALWRLTRSSRVMIAAICAVLVASFCYNVISTSSGHGTAYFLPQARFWQLMVGSLLAHLEQSGMFGTAWQKTSQSRGLAGAALIVCGFVLADEKSYPGWIALLPTLGAALVISSDSVINRYVLASRPLIAVGLISYPLYLWHWPLLSYARITRISEHEFAIPLLIVAAFVLAFLAYRLVEIPIRFKIKADLRRFAVTALLPAILVQIAALGIGASESNGWPARIPPEINALASFRYDYKKDYADGTCFLKKKRSNTSISHHSVRPNRIQASRFGAIHTRRISESE